MPQRRASRARRAFGQRRQPEVNPTFDLPLYSVVHLEAGIYHQGRTGVAAPTRQPGEGAPSGAVAEAERYATMTELAAYIESLS